MSRLPALERNILKYRAFEMVLMLFYIENLKAFVLDSIRATDKLHDEAGQRIPHGAKNIYGKAWAALVADGILSEEDKNEIERLVDYRNDIAHKIHELTYDLGRGAISRDHRKFFGVKYDYNALSKLTSYRKKIEKGIQSKYIISISFNDLLFEAAEKTYQQELRRLHKKITRQFAIRKTSVEETQGTRTRRS